MKPMDNMEEAIKKKLNFAASAKMRDRILDDVLKAQEKSKKTIPVLKEPNIWRIIMKSPNTKLVTAALILIAVFIGINLLNGSVTTVAWGDIAEHFESVPFFNLTIYIGNDTSAEAKKIEIWKSVDSHIRVHDDNKVIFADFNKGEITISAFDRSTRQPVNINTHSLAKIFIDILCPKGGFSLDTLISNFPSHTTGITPVETADTTVSKEIIVFEVKSDTTPEHLSIWALRDSKLPTRVCFRDPRNKEFGDFIFEYFEKKDAKFFDPKTFTGQ
jgi:hypothetical protein